MFKIGVILLVVNHIFSATGVNQHDIKIHFEDTEETILQNLHRVKRANEPVEQYASRMEQTYGIVYPTVMPNDKNSITQYTFKTVNNVKLPIVVRATIRPRNIQPVNSRPADAVSDDAKANCERMGMNRASGRNKDVYGHLIAYKNGGPSDFYNIVPQTTRINVGTVTNSEVNAPSIWYHSEMSMTDFVTKTQGHVEVAVVVFYNGSATRPSAFGVAESRYNSANALVQRFPDYYYSNNPNEDPDVLNG